MLIASRRYGYKVQLNYLRNNDITYYIVYQVNSKNVYKKIGRKSEGITEHKCMQRRNSIISDLRHGVDLSQKNSKFITMDSIANAYFIANTNHIKSIRQLELKYKKHIKDYFKFLPISELKDKMLYELQAIKIAQGLEKSTVNGIVKLIITMIKFAVKQEIISFNPFKNVKLFKTDNRRERFLKLEEINFLKDFFKDDFELNSFLILSLTTGARIEGILNIQAKHVDINNNIIYLKDFKRNMTYTIPLHTDIKRLMENSNITNENIYLVSNKKKATKYGEIYKKITPAFDILNENLNKKDRVNRVVIHTLRHTFASHLAINNTSILKIRDLLNHADIEQTMMYSHLLPSQEKEMNSLYAKEY